MAALAANEFFRLAAAVAAMAALFFRLFRTIKALEEWTFRMGGTAFMSRRSLSGVRLLTCRSKEAGPLPPPPPWGVVGVVEPVEEDVDMSLALVLGMRRLARKRAFFVLTTEPPAPAVVAPLGGGVWPRDAKNRSAGFERLSF